MSEPKELADSSPRSAPSTRVQPDQTHPDSQAYDEKKSIDVEEKSAGDDISVDDLDYKDEALRLVGMERKTQFSDEQYSRVRRKLVSPLWMLCALPPDLLPLLSVPVGQGHSAIMHLCVLHAVPVSLRSMP